MRSLFSKLLFISLIVSSCSKDKIIDIKQLNGYWEIKEVTLSDGIHKNYPINTVIDYYELTDSIGQKQKLQPQFDGTYMVMSITEKISVSSENKKLYLNYNTPYSVWKDEIIELADSIFVIKNEENIIYTYKRPVAFTLK